MFEPLKQCLTEDDNQTYDIGKIMWAVGVAVFLGLSVYSVVKQDHQFDPQGFGFGFGTALAAGGGMVAWMRRGDTQDPKP